MSEVLDRSQERLENISAIEPILRALRTVSMGSWQTALNRRANVQQYRSRLGAIYRSVLPLLAQKKPETGWQLPAPEKLVVLVIGTEQGLIGKFNRDLAEFANAYRDTQQEKGFQVHFFLLGSRLRHTFNQNRMPFSFSQSLSTTSLPAYALAARMARDWLLDYEGYRLDAVDILYNAYQGPMVYETHAERLIPFSPPKSAGGTRSGSWPKPIVETSPGSLYTSLIRQEIAIRLFEMLLDSAASEHAARYQLMEEAMQNSERLIEELNIDLQTIRRQQITREMQELAAGAGLLG